MALGTRRVFRIAVATACGVWLAGAWHWQANAYDLVYRSSRGKSPAYISPDMPCRLYFLLKHADKVREGADIHLHVDLPTGVTPVGLCVHRQSHCVDPDTFGEPKEVKRDGETFGYAVSGTPADCVKLGLCEIVKEPVDLLVSGINRGSNLGINAFYSGTVAAALEGALFKVPSIALSVDSYEDVSFQESGILDSTGFLELITFVEEKFAIEIADSELIPENLDTLRKMSNFVEGKMRARAAV